MVNKCNYVTMLVSFLLPVGCGRVRLCCFYPPLGHGTRWPHGQVLAALACWNAGWNSYCHMLHDIRGSLGALPKTESLLCTWRLVWNWGTFSRQPSFNSSQIGLIYHHNPRNHGIGQCWEDWWLISRSLSHLHKYLRQLKQALWIGSKPIMWPIL